jgi:transcriptional regulator with XRE-family HTH domain
MSLSEVSKKIGVKEDIIIQAESDERDNQFIKEPIQKLIQALGLRCEYIIIPYCCSKQSDIFKHNTHRQDTVKRFRKLSLLPQKPTEGWLRSMRNACGISQIKLAQHIHNICDDRISQTEIAEKKSQIQPKFLEPLLQTLDCRVELIFVPENINFLLNAITHREKNASPKKRKVRKSLKAKKQRTISSRTKRPIFPVQFEQLTLLPKRPPGSSIQILRKKNCLTQNALAKKVGCRIQQIGRMERAEREKRALYPPLEKIACALGCHLNYLFIPNKDSPFYPNLDENLGKEYDLTFQIAQQTPPEGWIASIRKILQLTPEDLAKRMRVDVFRISIFEKDEKNNKLTPPILKILSNILSYISIT